MLHSWYLSPREAVIIQNRLTPLVITKPLPERIKLVAGADVGYRQSTKTAVATVAVCSFPDLEFREFAKYESNINFPYVPGLLSFREIPLVLEAFQRLQIKPDVVLCDGQGVAHPRRTGLASHLGLWLELPTVGCAKTRLVGSHGKVGPRKGQYRSLTYHGERVGVVLRTRTNVKPVYVSPGHLADVHSSRRLVTRCCLKTRLPEPLRRAHLEAQKATKAR